MTSGYYDTETIRASHLAKLTDDDMRAELERRSRPNEEPTMTEAEILHRAMNDPPCFVTPNAQPVLVTEVKRLSKLLAETLSRENDLTMRISNMQLLEGQVAALKSECEYLESGRPNPKTPAEMAPRLWLTLLRKMVALAEFPGRSTTATTEEIDAKIMIVAVDLDVIPESENVQVGTFATPAENAEMDRFASEVDAGNG